MCEAIGRLDLRDDPSLATNAQRLERRVEVISIFAEIFRQDTAAAWTDRLGERGVPVAPMHTVADALTHEQTPANQRVLPRSEEHRGGNGGGRTGRSERARYNQK